MEKIKTDLENLYKSSNSLTQKMKESIIEIIKKAGGEIKTEDTGCFDCIFGIFYNEGSEAYEEHQVLAVKVENNQLLIYAEVYPDEKENWFTTDMVWQNATFTNLCGGLPDYVSYT